MRWPDLLLDSQDAWRDVRSRPFRSVLSAVGISVGVLALVAMMSITGGAREEALASAQSLGLDKVRIEATAVQPAGRSSGLTAEDATTIDTASGVDVRTTYFLRDVGLPVQVEDARLNVDRLAVPRSFFDLEKLQVRQGTLWSDSASHNRCLVGAAVAEHLEVEPGQVLLIDDSPCTVSGVLAHHARLLTEGTGLSAIDFDLSVYVPFDVLSGRFARAPVTGLITQVAEQETFSDAVAAVARALSLAHAGEQDFVTVVPRALAQQVNETQRLFALVMSTIAGLALLVGGIGIANSLLATVAEQTREIGLRMAVGATSERLLSLYVLHAMWICCIGAVSGAILGLLVATLIQAVADWRVHLSLGAVLVGVVFALITGALSAAYPALRASRMSAAQALIDQ